MFDSGTNTNVSTSASISSTCMNMVTFFFVRFLLIEASDVAFDSFCTHSEYLRV